MILKPFYKSVVILKPVQDFTRYFKAKVFLVSILRYNDYLYHLEK